MFLCEQFASNEVIYVFNFKDYKAVVPPSRRKRRAPLPPDLSASSMPHILSPTEVFPSPALDLLSQTDEEPLNLSPISKMSLLPSPEVKIPLAKPQTGKIPLVPPQNSIILLANIPAPPPMPVGNYSKTLSSDSVLIAAQTTSCPEDGQKQQDHGRRSGTGNGDLQEKIINILKNLKSVNVVHLSK